MDELLFRRINAQWISGFLDGISPLLQAAWPGLLLGVFIAAILYFRGGRRAPEAILAGVLAVVFADAVCTWLIKPLVARPRPSIALDHVRLLVGKKSGYGFPSNHAANMAAAAVVLGRFYRKWIPALAAAALFVGYSRVYVGVHYPFDVLAGFAVGGFCAVAALHLAKRISIRFFGRVGFDQDAMK